MEKQPLTEEKIRSIKTTYILSLILFIYFLGNLVLSICLKNVQPQPDNIFRYIFFAVPLDFSGVSYIVSLLFVLACIVFSKGTVRPKLISISFIFISVYLPAYLTRFNMYTGMFLGRGFILEMLCYLLMVVIFICLFVKMFGRRFNPLIIKIFYITNIVLLFAAPVYMVVMSTILFNGFYMGIGVDICIYIYYLLVPVLVLTIAYKGLSNYSFYKNFIEARPRLFS